MADANENQPPAEEETKMINTIANPLAAQAEDQPAPPQAAGTNALTASDR